VIVIMVFSLIVSKLWVHTVLYNQYIWKEIEQQPEGSKSSKKRRTSRYYFGWCRGLH